VIAREVLFGCYVLFQMHCNREHRNLSSRLANLRENSGCRTLRYVKQRFMSNASIT